MQINQNDCEYLVISSGAGEAVAFKTLSAEGKKILKLMVMKLKILKSTSKILKKI